MYRKNFFPLRSKPAGQDLLDNLPGGLDMFTKWILLAMIYLGVFHCFQPLVAKEIKLATQPVGNALTKQGEPYIICAMGMLNQSFKVSRIPWKRAQMGTKYGEYDGFFMASKNKDRDVYATFSEPFVMIQWLYVTKKERKISPNDANFNSGIFIANLGSARHKWLENQHKKGLIKRKIGTTQDTEALLKMLLLDRADVALMNSADFNHVVKKLSLDRSQIKTYIAREKPTSIYFSKTFIKANPKFLDQFNNSMIQCKKKLK